VELVQCIYPSTIYVKSLSLLDEPSPFARLCHYRRVGGFARAAARLHLSQPALSRQIQMLESELGVPLFDRVGRRIQLTSEGEDLLRRSRRLLAEAESLGERARMLKTGETGIVRVGATPQVIENLLAGFLIHYRQRHPGVEVHFVEDGGVRLHGPLERGDVHLTMTAAAATRFHDRLLYPMHLVAVVAAGHQLSRRAVLEITELADEPLLLTASGFGSREWFDAASGRPNPATCAVGKRGAGYARRPGGG
jgi:DNA-binding transcriptional LysR family regulator